VSLKTSQKRKQKKINIIPLLIILVTITGIIYYIPSVAKYVVNIFQSQATIPANYIFLSDYLSESNETFIVYGNTATFNIKNYDVMGYTKGNIEYIISSDKGGILSTTNSTLIGGANNNDEITLTGTPGTTYEVTATSTKPYASEIKAKFKFMDTGDNNAYQITDKGHYIVLDIYTNGSPINYTIDYTNFLADNTNDLMSNFTNNSNVISSGSFEPNSHYSLKFIKTNASSGTYSTQGILLYNNDTITLSSFNR